MVCLRQPTRYFLNVGLPEWDHLQVAPWKGLWVSLFQAAAGCCFVSADVAVFVIIELKNTLTCKHDSDTIFIQTHCTISFNSFGVISAVNVSIGLLRLRPYFLLQWVTRARPFVYSSISTHCRYSNPPQSLDQYYTNTSISKRYDNSRIQKCDTLTITGFLDPCYVHTCRGAELNLPT